MRRIDRVIDPDKPPQNADVEAISSARKSQPYFVRPSKEGMIKWLARVEGRFMGAPVDVHPHDAILWAMRVSAGEVVYCDQQIRRLEEDELFERPTKTQLVELPSGKVEEIHESREPEQFSRWVRWRDRAMKNMAMYAKMALDVGIEERQIQLAEKQAQQLVNVITAVLTDLGHDLRDSQTREIVRRRLMEGAIEGTVVENNGNGAVA